MIGIFTLAFFTWLVVEKVKELDEERGKKLLLKELKIKSEKSWDNIGGR